MHNTNQNDRVPLSWNTVGSTKRMRKTPMMYRELRVQHKGLPYRILYAFDPRRTAILLIGGNKVGNDRWYEQYIPVADRLYDEHLRELEGKG